MTLEFHLNFPGCTNKNGSRKVWGTFGEILFFVGFVLDVLFLFGRCGEWQAADNGETPGERTLRLSVLRSVMEFSFPILFGIFV